MKVMFFNDTSHAKSLYVNTLNSEDHHGIVPAHGFAVVDVKVDDSKQGVFVKEWDNGQVLITTYDKVE